MTNILNKIITAFKDLCKYLTFKRFARFADSLLSSLVDYLNLDTRQIFKLMLLFTFYSKIILIVSKAVTVPSAILVIAEECWSISANVASAIGKSIEKIGRYYYDENISVQHLKEEQSYLRELLSNQSEELNKERRYVQDLQEKYDSSISELQAEMQSRDATNRKLSIENSELVEKVKVSKITTKVETAEKFIMIGGNLAFVAIQCLNVYNRLFHKESAVDPNEIRKLIGLIESLARNFNVSAVNRTTAERVQRVQESRDRDNQTPETEQTQSQGITEQFRITEQLEQFGVVDREYPYEDTFRRDT